MPATNTRERYICLPSVDANCSSAQGIPQMAKESPKSSGLAWSAHGPMVVLVAVKSGA
jgi:hypothetical protein